jgi:hypothetical protein
MFTARNVFSRILVSSAASADETDRIDEALVEASSRLGALRCDAADHLWRVLGMPGRVPGVYTLGREAEVEVLSDLEPRRLESRQQDLARRARIGRRLEDDELAFTERSRHRVGRRDDERHVGIASLRERRRHADGDHVAFRQAAHVGRRLQKSLLTELCDVPGGDVLDMGRPFVDPTDDALVDVEADRAQAALGGFHSEG